MSAPQEVLDKISKGEIPCIYTIPGIKDKMPIFAGVGNLSTGHAIVMSGESLEEAGYRICEKHQIYDSNYFYVWRKVAPGKKEE